MAVKNKIKNKAELEKTPLRKAALDILEAGLKAIDTANLIRDKVEIKGNRLIIGDREWRLEKGGRLWAAAVGKCAVQAAAALEKVLGEKLKGGLAFDVQAHEEVKLRKLKRLVGTHPLPSAQNIENAKELVAFLEGLTEKDLLLFIVSGGGSTLLYLPQGEEEAAAEAELLKKLFQAGADIQEINTVRKHLSVARGGYLAKYAYPARVVSLIFSDVPGNNLEFIASGPTVEDRTTIEDAAAVLDKYKLVSPPLVETPKDDIYFVKVDNVLFVSNDLALQVMAQKAKALNFVPVVKTSELSGEARQAGQAIVKELENAPVGTAWFYGGETTVTIKGKGKGGRNQELVLAALEGLKEGQLIAAINSDGRDNTDAAGALGDIQTKKHAAKMNLDIERFLNDNNSYAFFFKIKDHIITGPTGSNVSDLVIALKE